MRLPVTLLFSLLVASCVGQPPLPAAEETPEQGKERRTKAPRPVYNLTGYPPAARDGYIDGCETARKSAYAHKDGKRFAADSQYSTGWSDGYSICTRDGVR